MKSRSMLIAVALIATSLLLNSSMICAQVAGETKTAAQLHQEPATADATTRTEVATTPSAGAAAAASSVPAKASVLSRGTTLLAEFSHTLNAKKLKPGDKVKATLTQDLVAGGKLLAKTESKLVGHVTEAKAYSAENRESRLGIVFDKILLKHHQELEFQGVVQALAPPAPRVSRVDLPDQMMPPPVMSVASSTPSGSRGSTSSSSNSSRSASSTTNLATSGVLGQVAVVGSTPGMTPGSTSAAAKASVSNNRPVSGGVGMRGIYGLKGLNLSPSASDGNPGPVIVSDKSDVKLENGTQVVLLVVDK
jgi:hypothetical protein